MVEKLFRQSAEFCSEDESWKLNVAHIFFMQEKYKECIRYYDPFVRRHYDDLLSITAIMASTDEIVVETEDVADTFTEDNIADDAGEPEIKLFNKWELSEIQINDISLTDYVAVKDKSAVYLPHTAGRYAKQRFKKAQCPIVERLLNAMMMHGRNSGKKLMTLRILKHTFEIIHLLTGENPVQILVDAVVNSGPREDSTRVGRAGTVRRQAVDVSPLRRVNQAIFLLTSGARSASFRNIKTIAECLADELINAAKGSSNSYAIKKKDELERVAKSNR